MLSLRIRIETETGVGAAGAKVGPINHILHSMFNQIDVYFNQKLVSPPNNAYAYRAYIEALLNYASPVKTSHLASCLWYSDTAGNMDALPGATSNHGLDKRAAFVQGGRTLNLIGYLHCDVFNQDKFLINGVEVRMRLVRSKDSFCLMEGNTMSRIRILDATLLIRRARINQSILLTHTKMLTRTIAKYPLTRVEVKSFTIHSGVVGETPDNVILGQIPKRIIIGFVDNKAFNGVRPLQPKFSGNEMLYAETYHTLFSGTGIHFLNETNSISREDYPAGYTLFAFDLTPDLSANCAGQWNLVKHGSLRMEVRFERALTTMVNCLVYAEFESLLEIDCSRQVIVDYSG
ncbi:uncharacterized protein F54H12.2-like [Harpegnathos saltator]|uniref:uncharacterized protein F54H12.2-like n=1 Tax=Harpegnathos saltator TaxID=610380 RepID=UPI000DBEF117|nr:uncharacterized protein F54H12.2-like [Harpegnathos saltator]